MTRRQGQGCAHELVSKSDFVKTRRKLGSAIACWWGVCAVEACQTESETYAFQTCVSVGFEEPAPIVVIGQWLSGEWELLCCYDEKEGITSPPS